MNSWLAASQFVVLTAAIVGLATAFILRMAWPWIRHPLRRLDPVQRGRWLLAIAAAPVLVSVAQAAVCAVPALLAASWHHLDHGGLHTHGGAAHIQACVSHPPMQLATWPALLLTLLMVGGVAWRLVGTGRSLARGHASLRELVATAATWRGGRLRILELAEPVACIVGRAKTVVVSRGLIDALDDRQLAAVLAHERAHGQRNDATWWTVATLLACTHLPTVGGELLEELRLASEQACDEAAAREVGDRLTVAEALVTVERLFGTCLREDIATFAPAFSGATTSYRVTALLEPPVAGPGRWHGRLVVAATIAAAVLLTHPMQHLAESVAGLLGT